MTEGRGQKLENCDDALDDSRRFRVSGVSVTVGMNSGQFNLNKRHRTPTRQLLLYIS